MYSRYIRDDRGTYTRVSAECAPPPPPVGERKQDTCKPPPRSENTQRPRESRPCGKPPDRERHAGGEKPCGEPSFGPPPPPHERPVEAGFLNRLLEQLHLGDLDAGDLLLLFLLFFLFKQKADEELLIAMGLLLIL